MIKPLAALLAAVCVAGCSSSGGSKSSPSASPSPKVDRFVKLVRAAGGAKVRNDTDADIVQLGRQICGLLREGGTYEEYQLAAANQGFTPFQAWTIAGTSTAALCPAQSSLIPPNSPPP